MMVMVRIALVLGMAAALPVVGSAADGVERIRVPEGFVVEQVAGPPLTTHPMMAGFDDQGGLFIAEAAGVNLRAPDLIAEPPNSVLRLTDIDGDGVFDKQTVFADRMTLPMGAQWHRGSLYVASPPNVWKLEDTNGDGVADERTMLVDQFGFSGNAASIHGCFLGPNGRMYWCDGRHGHEFRDEQGNVTSQGKAARIFSCKLDGTDVRTHCGGGMDNPVEVVFLPTGEMLGTVNIMHNPRGDCLVHWMHGGVYPREDQADCVAEFPSTGGLLPEVHNFGHVAVSGLAYHPGASFGPEYAGNVFVSEFNTHKVKRVVLERSGATFAAREEEFLVSDDPDFHPTDVLVDGDGSLLVIDTGGWFRIGCPTSQVAKPDILGGVYRVRRVDAAPVKDKYGLAVAWKDLTDEQVIDLLDDVRPPVVERATETLASRAAWDAMGTVIEDPTTNETVRRNCVWALSRMDAEPAKIATATRPALDDPAFSVRLAGVRTLGIYGDPRSVALLSARLDDEEPAVRREAATALSRLMEAGLLEDGARSATAEALFAGLAKNPDRVLEHALIHALLQLNDDTVLLTGLEHPHPRVRQAALIVLSQRPEEVLTRERILPLLDTEDPQLRKTVMEVVGSRPEWDAEIQSLLQQWLAGGSADAAVAGAAHGVLLARIGEPEMQMLLATGLENPALSTERKQNLIEIIGRSGMRTLPDHWISPLMSVLSDNADETLRASAVRIIDARGWADFDGCLQAVWNDTAEPATLRVAAASAVAPRLSALSDDQFEHLTGILDDTARETGDQVFAARALSAARLTDQQLIQLADTLAAAEPLVAPLLLKAFAGSTDGRVGHVLVKTLRESGTSGLTPDETAAVLRRYPEDVQREGRPLLESLGIDPAAQQAKMESLSAALEGGEAAAGRAVFLSRKAQCAACHVVAGQGGRVGPELTTIGASRGRRDLLEAIVLPSASFARGYRSYNVLTVEGKVHTGIIAGETTDRVLLRSADLAERWLRRDDIEELAESRSSIMPQGFDKSLTIDELRDLLAYLQSLK